MSFTSAIGAVAAGYSIDDYDPSEPLSDEDVEFQTKAADFPVYYAGGTRSDWADSGDPAQDISTTLSASDLVGKLIV